MTTVTTILSSKGQIVIPKEIRDELHWQAGTQITLVSSASGVTLKAVPKATGRHFLDLVGSLRHEEAALSTAELCRPVDFGEEETP